MIVVVNEYMWRNNQMLVLEFIMQFSLEYVPGKEEDQRHLTKF